jgi:toxin FitB
MIVLDTNVVSEVVKPAPAETVLAWLAGQPSSQLFITAITQAEILYGLELMPKGKRRVVLAAALEAMFAEDFAGRILAFDSEAARMYAQIAASRRARGRTIAQSDAEVAAIARARGASLATRNTRDFEHCGVVVVNPWEVSG